MVWRHDFLPAGVSGEQEWFGEPASANSLSQLSQALQRATASPRFFRTIAQWSAAFQRFTVVAVATGQWTWAMVSCHIDTIMSIAEQERLSAGSALTAVLYDDLIRKSWATRSQRRDPSLDLAGPQEAS